jgi:hypothetical protein
LKIPKGGNQNPQIEKGQTTQWPNEKVQKDKQRCTKHTYKPKDRVTRTPLKTGVELRCSWKVSSSSSTSDTRRVNLDTNPVISYQWEKDRELFMTSGTYPWSFVTQIFHSGQPSHGDDFNFTKRNAWFRSFLVSSNPLLRKSWWAPQALEYRINWEIYTLYACTTGMLLVKTYNFVSKDIQICLKKEKVCKLFVCGFRCVFTIFL